MNSNTVTQAPVLVTGAAGFLAGHLIQQLLAKGYKVRATVRDLRLNGRIEHLHKFPEASTQLEIIEMDVLDMDSIDRALVGVYSI
mgnify:CR=1 FL=1